MSVKKQYASKLLLSLQDMRESEFICDFTIKVGVETFPVHRVLVAAASKYFKAMLSTDMKELKEGSVRMVDMDPAAVKICLEFMYSGQANITSENVHAVLPVTHLLQIDDLTELCFHFLQNNISAATCLSAISASKLYERDGLGILAENILLDQFQDVVMTPEFKCIPMEQLAYYVQKANIDYDVIWKAIVSWFGTNHEEQINLHIVLARVNFRNFPFDVLLHTVLEEDVVRACQKSMQIILVQLFTRPLDLMKNLSIDNFYHLRNLSKTVKVPRTYEIEVNTVFNKFFKENFQKLSQKHEFLCLREEEILGILKSLETKFASEKMKWYAMLKWTKQDHQRQKLFPKLFRCLKLEALSLDFIKNEIRADPLVQESHECKDALLDAVGTARATSSSKSARHIICLSRDDGIIGTLDVRDDTWLDVGKISQNEILGIANVRENIYVLSSTEVVRMNLDCSWTKISATPSDVCTVDIGAVVCFQDCIYLITINSSAMFDPVTRKWTKDLSGCELHPEFCAASSDEYIFAMGGEGLNDYTDAAKSFNPKSKIWTNLPHMMSKRGYASAAVLKGKVVVMGGCNNETSLPKAEIYHLGTNTWMRIPDMHVPRMWLSACVVDDKLYAIGGSRDVGGKTVGEQSIEVYEQRSGTWSLIERAGPRGPTLCCAFSSPVEWAIATQF